MGEVQNRTPLATLPQQRVSKSELLNSLTETRVGVKREDNNPSLVTEPKDDPPPDPRSPKKVTPARPDSPGTRREGPERTEEAEGEVKLVEARASRIAIMRAREAAATSGARPESGGEGKVGGSGKTMRGNSKIMCGDTK